MNYDLSFLLHALDLANLKISTCILLSKRWKDFKYIAFRYWPTCDHNLDIQRLSHSNKTKRVSDQMYYMFVKES